MMAEIPPANPCRRKEAISKRDLPKRMLFWKKPSPPASRLHAPIEAHGSVVKWEGNKITIWDSTQGVYDAHDPVCDER